MTQSDPRGGGPTRSVTANPDIVRAGKALSWLLRHGAAEAGVEMDPAGWVDITAALRVLQMDRGLLDQVVAHNEKRRFEIDGPRIRAVQGHSATLVDPLSLESSWDVYEGAGPVWHGTTLAALSSILRHGLLPQGRSHVHLAPAQDSVVGKRAAVDVLLEVSVSALRAAGLPLFQAPNGVVLSRVVPADAIVGIIPRSRAALARAQELAALRTKAKV